jgi:tRNA modification GTPase
LETAPSLSSSLSNSAAAQEAIGPGTLRQKELIEVALASVQECLALADQQAPLDIIAPLFRSAVDSLGEITGEVSNADILETMFSRFCVGK